MCFLDITDLLEFYARRESSSGVQRVIEGVTPHLVEAGLSPVSLDRSRGVLVEMDPQSVRSMIEAGDERDERAGVAHTELDQLRSRNPISIDQTTTIVFPGAVWISDAMISAAWWARSEGARLIFLLYDLTPVMEVGHTAAVNMLFDRYLNLVARTASRVPAISESSRRDFEIWCEERALSAPKGRATRLPNAIHPENFPSSVVRPWPRPYVLMVGTVEARKNHVLALHAWKKLLNQHGADRVPDLVCIGRLGWHADEFLRDFQDTHGLSGKIHLLTASTSDQMLADFYRHCDFTIYPSRYEGWGLPVSESISFGKLPIVADNSSLPEAGGDLAAYFESGNVEDFVRQIETHGLNQERLSEHEDQIRSSDVARIGWDDVARILLEEVRETQSEQGSQMMAPEVVLGREYMASPYPNAPDGAHADKYVDFLVTEAQTPLLGQDRDLQDWVTTDQLLTGQFGAPQAWGLELHPHRQIRISFVRPVDGPLSLLIATRSMPGRVRVSIVAPGGDRTEDVYLGSALRVDLGDGLTGSPAIAYLTVLDASDSVEGFLGIRSLVILRSDDHQLEVAVLQSVAKALRQELDFMTHTRSWRLTAPLRRRWGRSVS